jgi:predicted enzyme related to lactoylglutathione lyase
MAGIAKIGNIMLDVNDLQKERTFWEAVLGVEASSADEEFVWFHGSSLALQRVSEQKSGKNRAHPDMGVEDLDAAIPQLEALGATVLQPPPTEGFRWAVMADPEGNEFCISAG